MKVSKRGAAKQAIADYVGQGAKAQGKQAAGKASKAGKAAKVSKVEAKAMDKISALAQQVIGQQPDPVITRPPAMRYGIRPPAPEPEDPPVALRYGIIPPPPADDPPIAMRYGIRPPMPTGDGE